MRRSQRERKGFSGELAVAHTQPESFRVSVFFSATPPKDLWSNGWCGFKGAARATQPAWQKARRGPRDALARRRTLACGAAPVKLDCSRNSFSVCWPFVKLQALVREVERVASRVASVTWDPFGGEKLRLHFVERGKLICSVQHFCTIQQTEKPYEVCMWK